MTSSEHANRNFGILRDMGAGMMASIGKQLAAPLLGVLQRIGELALFTARVARSLREFGRALPAAVDSLARVGADSVPVASVMAFFIGMVLALQTGIELARYGSQNLIGAILAHSLVRELGPVLTAFIIAGRAGSAITAELGVMRVYEEIDALDTLSIDPYRYLVLPRVLACLVAVPCLSLVVDAVGIAGGAVMSHLHPQLFLSYRAYADSVAQALTCVELARGVLKATVFGVIVALISCECGFATTGGPRGIGYATTRSVVQSFLWILIADYLVTRITM